MAKLAGDHVSVSVDNSSGTAKDITLDVNAVDTGIVTDAHDVAAFGEAFHNFVPGQADAPITLTGLFNSATDRSHDVLKDLQSSGVVVTITIGIGQNTAPTTGDPEFEGEYYCVGYTPSASNAAAITFTANFVVANATGAVWGTVA